MIVTSQSCHGDSDKILKTEQQDGIESDVAVLDNDSLSDIPSLIASVTVGYLSYRTFLILYNCWM